MKEIYELLEKAIDMDELIAAFKEEIRQQMLDDLKEELKEELKDELAKVYTKPLTKKELATKYSCSVRTINRIIQRGDLKAVSTVGKKLVFDENDFRNLSK